MKEVFLDYASATPMSQAVYDAIQPYLMDQFYNPSSLYLSAQKVKQAVDSARADVALELGCKKSEIIFTAGGTESDNLAINGVMSLLKDGNLVVSAIEHDAVLEPAGSYDHKIAAVDSGGVLDIDDLASKIDDKTVLVSIMYANNEVGSIQPIKEVSKLIAKIKTDRVNEYGSEARPLYFHTDACQAANYLPLLVNELGVDMMTLNGGKIYGPKQSGILFVKTGVKLQPQILGGGQERDLRSGTENVAGMIGFAAALREASSMRQSEVIRLGGLRDKLINYLSSNNVVVNGSSHRLANNIHFTIPGVDNETLLMRLDELGFMVATGSACSASNDEPSHVLRAMGLEEGNIRSSIRLTLGRQTGAQDIDSFIAALKDVAPGLRR